MIVCLGEGLVDLICERRVGSLVEADSFVPHFGGALANVAVHVARSGDGADGADLAGGAGGGLQVGMAGAVGDDEWGRWLCDRLEREGVNLRFFNRLEGEPTPVAFASFDDAGDPSFQIYGDAIERAVASIGPRIEAVVAEATALVYSSTTLATDAERAVTLRARELALERGAKVCFDPNIRPNRWGGEVGPAARASRELIPGSFLVRANREEAIAIAGVDDPREAAAELAELGAELAVVTLADEGAVIRGACDAELPAPAVPGGVVTTLGAGDAFMGTLVGGLAARDWDPSAAPEALGPALEAAAQACSRWGALD